MSPDEPITYWIARLKDGDHEAAQQIWERYFQRLVGLAHVKLGGRVQGAADAEDVALSAFASFCRATENARFPRLNDRTDLWQVLLMLTARKARHMLRDQQRQKRGGGRVQNEAALTRADDDGPTLDQVIGDEPTPEFAAQLAEECERLLSRLADADLRSVALWKMEGWTNQEIAARLGCVERTVERRLELIRKKWNEEGFGEQRP